MLDGDAILWWTDVAEPAKSVIPRTIVLGIPGVAHRACGHPGVARNTTLLQWSRSKNDVPLYSSPYIPLFLIASLLCVRDSCEPR